MVSCRFYNLAWTELTNSRCTVMNPPRGRNLSSKWVSYPALIEVILADTIDKEGEDRFCHFVEKMPPVSYSRMTERKLIHRNLKEWSDSLTEGYASYQGNQLTTGLLLRPRI
jgi:hypothetical protein